MSVPNFQGYWFGTPLKQRAIIPVIIGPRGPGITQEQYDSLLARLTALETGGGGAISPDAETFATLILTLLEDI
jgi:hypothetical protein